MRASARSHKSDYKYLQDFGCTSVQAAEFYNSTKYNVDLLNQLILAVN